MVALLTLVLLVLPGLTSSFSYSEYAREDQRGNYQRIASAASRSPSLQPYPLGDRYPALRRAVLEELAQRLEGQASQEELQTDDRVSVAELSDLPSRSEEPMFRSGSLLSRVLSGQTNGGARDNLYQDADSQPLSMMDYPQNRKFVNEDISAVKRKSIPGGPNTLVKFSKECQNCPLGRCPDFCYIH